MQAAVRAALRQILIGLEFDLLKATRNPTVPLPLQLYHEDSSLLPAGTSIFLNLVDHMVYSSQRRQMALEYRALLEILVRLMSTPSTQWNAYYNEIWDPELMQHFEDYLSLIADQRPILENHSLPTFVLRLGAKDLFKDDFDLCYEFLTCPSAQVLSVAQQTLLERANGGVNPPQLGIELGLQLSSTEPTKEVLSWLRDLLERLEVPDQTDPIKFPVLFKITTLWFGMNAFAMPCDMDLLMDVSSFTGICAQSYLPDQYSSPYDDHIINSTFEDFPPRVLLDSSARRFDLSELDFTGQHIRSICSTIRATDHIQEVSFMCREDFSVIDGLGSRLEFCTGIRVRS